MKETSTQTEVKVTSKQVTEMPKKSTLEFIRQFARVYSAEPRLAVGLQGMVLN